MRTLVWLLVFSLGLSVVQAAPAPRSGKVPQPASRAKTLAGSDTATVQQLAGDFGQVNDRAVRLADTPPQRSAIVRALAAKPGARQGLDSAARTAGLSISQLATRAQTGKRVMGGPMTAQGTSAGSPRVDMTFDDFDWDAGVEFSPAVPGPLYRRDGRNYPLGEMTVWGARQVPDLDLTGMYRRDVLLLRAPANGKLRVELPGEGDYMITLQFIPADGSNVSSWLGSEPCPVTVELIESDRMRSVDLAPLSGHAGVSTSCHITPVSNEGFAHPDDTAMHTVSAVVFFKMPLPVPSYLRGANLDLSRIWELVDQLVFSPGRRDILFGGITITRA